MAYHIGNITLPYTSTSGSVLVTSGTGYSGGGYTINTGTSNGTWATSSSPGAIQVKGDALFEGKVMINGQDLAETLETIKDRLAILVPDPKLLDKYEALKQAYEHYKTLEALCVEQSNPDNQP